MKSTTLFLVLLFGCSSSAPKLPVATLEDPTTCMECHSAHYTQWSGSMHAYASDDPVFLAMNKRGQRETQNQLGTFCVQCHAPMAVALGLVTADTAADFDPTTLPPTARGITCYFCHNVATVQADHNNGLVLALDDTMRGGVGDPTDSPAHNSAYDKTMDSYTNQSTMCGSCHDVVTPAGIALERTYSEWQNTLFAMNDPSIHLPLTCSACHMATDPTTTVIADKSGLDVKSRPNSFHFHYLSAIDQATTTFPETDTQATQVQQILDPALTVVGPRPVAGGASPGGICVTPQAGGQISVRMDTLSVGHMYPSGAAQDRRVWLELIAYDVNNVVLYSSGVVPDGMDPEDLNDPIIECTSPGLYACSGFWDRTFQADGSPAHFFWDVATETSHHLQPPVTNDPNSPLYDHSTTVVFPTLGVTSQIDHITARIRTRPFAYSVLDQLVSSGDLDPSLASSIKTLDSAGATRTWTRATENSLTFCNPF